MANEDGNRLEHQPAKKSLPPPEKEPRIPEPIPPPAGTRHFALARRASQVIGALPVVVKIIGGVGGIIGIYLALAQAFCWRPFDCGPPNIVIDVTASRFNPRDYDDPREEYVCLVNMDDRPINLLGWVLRDARSTVNTLPNFTLIPQKGVRVHAGKGRDTATDVFGTSKRPVWTNDGDTVTLGNRDDTKVDSQHYSEREQNDGAVPCGAE